MAAYSSTANLASSEGWKLLTPRLIQRRAPDTGLNRELEQLRGLVDSAHGHLRDAIHHLHPVTVTRFGLVRALTIGPIAEMVRASGVRYECRMHGPVERLDAAVATDLQRDDDLRAGAGNVHQLAAVLGEPCQRLVCEGKRDLDALRDTRVFETNRRELGPRARRRAARVHGVDRPRGAHAGGAVAHGTQYRQRRRYF